MADAPTILNLEQVAALLRSTAQTIRAEEESLGNGGMRWHPALRGVRLTR